MPQELSVREIETKDIDLIADYWVNSDPDFMVGMGVDLSKLPTREGVHEMLNQQIQTPIQEKEAYALIWEINGKQVGHSNVNKINFGIEAYMHLHMWNNENRSKGAGTELAKRSLPYYFQKLKLQNLYCEPYALNPAPTKTLERVGFEFEKKYVTIPGPISFEQEVNRWKMTREKYQRTRS